MAEPATIYPASSPQDADLDAMVEDGYWYVSGVVDNFYRSYIGMYGDTRDDSYWFYHSFVSVDGILAEGVDLTVMYQMGDDNSDWEGVHIVGEADMPYYDYQMSYITLSNSGWSQETPEVPGSTGCSLEGGEYVTKPCSSFEGIYDTGQGRVTIWR